MMDYYYQILEPMDDDLPIPMVAVISKAAFESDNEDFDYYDEKLSEILAEEMEMVYDFPEGIETEEDLVKFFARNGINAIPAPEPLLG